MKMKFPICLIEKKKLKKIKTKQSNNNIQLNSKSYLSNKIKDTKINLEKNRKLYHCYRQKESKIKTENLSEIMSLFDNNNNNLFINNNTNRDKQGHISNINPINDKNKNKKIIKKNNIKDRLLDIQNQFHKLECLIEEQKQFSLETKENLFSLSFNDYENFQNKIN